MTAALRAEEPSAKYLSQAAEALARRFELLATAPAGVGRLRTLILTLAVRGKLLPQVFSDEPASGLVAQARSEMDTLAADGLVRAERVSKDVEARDCPYEIPTKWAWVRLATVLPFRIGKTPPTKDLRFWSKNGTRWVSIADMTHRGRVSETQRRVSALADDLFGYPPLPRGTLVMSFKLTIGKISVLEEPAFHNEAIASFLPLAGMSTEFLSIVLPAAAKDGASKNAIMGATLNSDSLSNLLLPIPPLAEQHRIVGRVEELMKLCDALEQSGRLADEQHARLTSTLFDALAASESAHALAEIWQRIAEHFDLLLDRPEAIAALEQTILQLAVRGLLVPSDSRPIYWEETTTGAVVNFLNGYAFKSEWFQSKGVRLVRNVNVAHGTLSWANGVCVDDAVVQDMERFALHAADLVISLDRPIISSDLKYAVVRERDLPCLLLQRVAKMTPNAEVLDPAYLELWLQSPAFIGSIDPGRSNGVPHISTRQLEAIPFLLPPLAEQHRIVARVEELRLLCTQLRERLSDARHTQSQLADAMVQQVTNAPSPPIA